MPATLTTFADSEIAVKWQEQYVSQALNRDMAALAAKGVYRGFMLSTSGTALAVSVLADDAGDHAAGAMTSTGNLLGIRRTGGSFTLALNAYAGKTVVIALYATYAAGFTTTAEIRAYELSPSDEFTAAGERPYLVPIGTVTVPGSGTVPAGNIRQTYRLEAWEGASLGANQPTQLLQNGGFELCFPDQYDRHSIFGWARSSPAGVESFFASDTAPASGSAYHIKAEYAGSPVLASLSQSLYVPCVAGDRFRVRMKVRAVAAATSGTLDARFIFNDETGTTISVQTLDVPITAAEGAYRDLEAFVIAPANSSFLSSFQFLLNNVTLASAGDIVYIDDVAIWREPTTGSPKFSGDPAEIADATTAALRVVPHPAVHGTSLAQLAQSLLLRYDGTYLLNEASIVAGRADGNDAAAVPPVLQWLGRLIVGRNKAVKLNPTLYTYHYVGSGSAPVSLIWQSEGYTSGNPGLRLYGNGLSGALYLTINAKADDNATLTWTPDDNGQASFRLTVGDPGGSPTVTAFWSRIEYVAPGPTSWVESDWEQLYVGGEERVRPVTFTGPTTATIESGVGVVFVNTTGGAISLNLPTVAVAKNRVITIKDKGGALATNALTLVRVGSEKIEGLSTNFVFEANFGKLRLFCDGTDWWFI